MGANLFIVGVPLEDGAALSDRAKSTIEASHVIIGESRKIAQRYLKQIPSLPPDRSLFFLDHLTKNEQRELERAVLAAYQSGNSVALFSDTGMPVLFDPGKEVLDLCRKIGFSIHSVPSATSWSTACAMSGFSPPFYLLGFLEREAAARESQLHSLRSVRAQLVLMDTPYRFRPLLEQCRSAFSRETEAFLAWEISLKSERFFWGTFDSLTRDAARLGLEKGEFVLIVKRG